MFAVEVRDHIMIAHSFRGAAFGPAQALHGATLIVDATFTAETLDANGLVIDIDRAHKALKAVLGPLNYRNLDELPELKSANTTTEFLSKYIFDQLAHIARAGTFGRDARATHGDQSHNFGIAYCACVVRSAVVGLQIVFVLGDLDAGERCDHCSQSTDIDAAPVRVDLLAAVEIIDF